MPLPTPAPARWRRGCSPRTRRRPSATRAARSCTASPTGTSWPPTRRTRARCGRSRPRPGPPSGSTSSAATMSLVATGADRLRRRRQRAFPGVRPRDGGGPVRDQPRVGGDELPDRLRRRRAAVRGGEHGVGRRRRTSRGRRRSCGRVRGTICSCLRCPDTNDLRRVHARASRGGNRCHQRLVYPDQGRPISHKPEPVVRRLSGLGAGPHAYLTV